MTRPSRRSRGHSTQTLRPAMMKKTTHKLRPKHFSFFLLSPLLSISGSSDQLQGSAKRCFLGCVSPLPGSAWLQLSKQPRLFADLCRNGEDSERRSLSRTYSTSDIPRAAPRSNHSILIPLSPLYIISDDSDGDGAAPLKGSPAVRSYFACGWIYVR